MYSIFVEKIKSEYVDGMLSKRRKKQESKAGEHVEEVEGFIEQPTLLEKLTEEYSASTNNPTLLGWRRFILFRGGR